MKTFSNFSLKKKISFSVLILISIVSLGVGILSYTQAYLGIKNQVRINAPQIAEYSSQLVKTVLEKHLSIVNEIAKNADVVSMNNARQMRFISNAGERLGYLGMGIIHPDGTAYYPDGTTAKLGDREYFKKAMSGTANFSDVIISRVTNSPVMIIASPIYSNQENVIAVLLVRLDASWLSEVTDRIGYGDRGYSYIIDGKGTFLAHNDRNLVMEQVNYINKAKEDVEYKSVSNLFEDIVNGKGRYGEYRLFAKRRLAGYTPISGTGWSLAVCAYQRDIFRDISSMSFNILTISLLFIIFGMTVSFFLSGNIIKPVKIMTDMLKDISEGDGDLTKRLTVTASDEIGNASTYFNKTLDKIKTLVKTIKDQSATLSEVGGDLSSNMIETASAVNEISANIQSVKNQTANQSESVVKTISRMKDIIKFIEKLNDYIERQSVNVTQSSSAIEEMIASINSVSETLKSNTININDLSKAAEYGRADLGNVVNDIQEVAKQSEGLLEINKVIQRIASQTNLLAMNAAIEAAHAGESGKGFAVVADEIRTLAESSGDQAKTVSKVLKEIKISVDKITGSTSLLLQKFNEMENSVQVVSRQETVVRNAMEEQAAGSKQILIAVGQLNEITEKVRGTSLEMFEGSRHVNDESSKLNDITEEITNSINEMAAGTKEITIAVNHVNDISSINRESIDKLVSEVNKFKV